LGSGGNWPRTRRLFGRDFPMPAPEDRGGWYDELMAAGMLSLRGLFTGGYRQMARTAPLFGHTGVFPVKYAGFRNHGRLNGGPSRCKLSAGLTNEFQPRPAPVLGGSFTSKPRGVRTEVG
jgi:hypothetical protein